MSEILEMTQQTAVSSIGSTDRLYVESGGRLRPVTLDTLAKAVRETVKVGGRNLLLNSSQDVANSIYNTASYYLTDSMKNGDECVLTLWGELGEGRSMFKIHNSGDDCRLCDMAKISEGVYRGTFNWQENRANNFIKVFAYPGNLQSVSRITRIKLERGNIATDWTPAPEDLESAKSGGVIQFTLYADSHLQKGGSQYECNDGTFRGYAQGYSCGCYGLPWICEGAFGRGDSTGEIHNRRLYARIGADEVFRSREHSAISATGGDEPWCSRHYPKGDADRQRSSECGHACLPSRGVEAVVQVYPDSRYLIAVKRRKEVAYV